MNIGNPGPSLLADLTSLALNVYYEARSEPRVGQLAVALVTLNRVEDDRWPNTIGGVVWQDTKPDVPGGEQFSWTEEFEGSREALSAIKDVESFKEALGVALEALEGAEDFTEGAVLYHAYYVDPYWRRHVRVDKVAEIGSHIFYYERHG